MIAVEPVECPENERFVVTQLGFDATISLLGRGRLVDLGALDPE